MRKTCLIHALNKWREEGGFLLIRKSVHWGIPHVMHLDAEWEKLSNYAPPEKLPAPWHSVFGFEGIELNHDSDPAEKMSVGGIVTGAMLLLISAVIWALRTKLEELSWRFWLPPNK